MKYLGLLSCFIGIIIHSFALNYCYKQVTRGINIKKNILYYLYILLLSLVIFYINMFVKYTFRIFFFYLTLLLFYKALYKENTFITLFKTLMIYIVLIFSDLVSSIFIMLIPNIENIDVEYMNFIKAFCTIFDSVFIFCLFKLKIFLKLFYKLEDFIYSKSEFIIKILIVGGFATMCFVGYYNAFSKSFNSLAFSFSLSVLFLGLILLLAILYFKKKQKENEQQQLLDIMKEYEELLDINRETRHEMFNNLLILKTTKNKSSKKYEELLDSFLDKYSTKTVNRYSSLYNLPTGIKGIVYYKMATIKENEIAFTSFTDVSMYDKFDKLDSKIYYKVCKILGILLDNAIEASKVSKDKHLMIDIYEEDEYLIIYIENSFKGKVDLNEINEKGVSSKGEGRGLGLYIVNKVIKSDENLLLEQSILDKKFISTLKIKL